jgi:ligand-binding sensor domain-containing protein
MRGADRRERRSVLHLALLPLLVLVPVCESVAERLPVKAYTTDHGLAHNRVKRIVQGSRGFVWFCTADGLSRLDGYQFTNYRVDDGLPAPFHQRPGGDSRWRLLFYVPMDLGPDGSRQWPIHGSRISRRPTC